MPSARETAQRKRSEGRSRRRKEPADVQDQGAPRADDGDSPEETEGQPLDALKQAAKVVAASAALGAAAAAGRSLGERRATNGEEAGATEGAANAPEPEGNRPSPTEHEPEEPEHEPEAPEPVAEEPQQRPRQVPGATLDGAREVVDEARGQLESLLGKPAETVSALERTDDGWLVTIEVVDVARIPDSTDVLASYEIELDEKRNLRRYGPVRRYVRSQASRQEPV
jgi:hypothetical protein